MPFQLECLTGAMRGKNLRVSVGKPLNFAIRRQQQDAGQVQVEQVGEQCVATNRSGMPLLVNGQEHARSVLTGNDEVVIGKDRFLVHHQDDGDIGTQQLGGAIAVGTVCSVCDGAFVLPTGWTDGARRICHRCLMKGVKPDHLPRPANLDEATMGELDLDVVTDRHAEAQDEESTEHDDSARLRSQKRLSASQLSVVESAIPEKPSLLRKVAGAVFATPAGTKEDRERLDALERERHAVLVEAGRLSLAGGGIGLSDGALSALLAGKTVSINAGDINRPVLDNWKAHRERVAYLDAEIAARRHTLHLGQDTESLLMPPPPLRPEAKKQQERAFASLDSIGTEDLANSDTDSQAEPVRVVPPPRPASQSQSRRVPPRRRR